MKTIFVFACVVVALALADHLPENERVFLKQVHDSCQANPATYCDEDILRKLHLNVDNHDALIHMRCMAEKAGLQNADGSLNTNEIRKKIGVVTDDKSKVEGLVSKCVVKKETPEKTAVLFWICLVQNNVPYYHKL